MDIIEALILLVQYMLVGTAMYFLTIVTCVSIACYAGYKMINRIYNA